MCRFRSHFPTEVRTNFTSNLVFLGADDWTSATKALAVWNPLAYVLSFGIILPSASWSVRDTAIFTGELAFRDNHLVRIVRKVLFVILGSQTMINLPFHYQVDTNSLAWFLKFGFGLGLGDF